MYLGIGSEFFQTEHISGERIFLLSGRTALDFILRDIIKERKIESALLPSFCCHTMIEPFQRNGIPVRFYDVYYSQDKLWADIPRPKEKEIFFKIKYFGYSQLEGIDDVSIQNDWECVIEDCTHSWLSTDSDIGNACADYRFASYRKWTGLSGIAYAEKSNGSFVIEQQYRTNEQYEALRLEAQQKKQKYFNGGTEDKSGYLTAYANAEKILDEEYRDYVPSLATVQKLMRLDISHIRRKREENADYLINRLKEIEGIHLMFSARSERDVPLCVPILVDIEQRDRLRKYLISKEIYCPVHWPVSEMHQGISDRAETVYKQEISLICDQRYGIDDMERETRELHSFFHGDRL